MTAKEFFTQAFYLNKEIVKKQGILDRLNDSVTGISCNMQQDVVSHTRNVHSMEDMIAKIVDLKDEINEAESRLTEAKAQIRSVLAHVSDEDEKTILELRYLGLKKWGEIADIMQIHFRTVMKKQTHAFDLLNDAHIVLKNIFDFEKMPHQGT